MRTLSFAKVPPSWGDPELQVKSLPYCQVEANSSFICLTTTFLPLIKSHCRVESLEILFYHHKCFLLCKLLFIKERIFLFINERALELLSADSFPNAHNDQGKPRSQFMSPTGWQALNHLSHDLSRSVFAKS